jgi:hypothetical protein
MRVVRHARRILAPDRGAVLVMAALWMPVLLLFGTFVIDVGNWFVHKRHLQMQADAAALAGAQEFHYPGCSNTAVNARVAQYGGDLHNAQVGGTSSSVFRLVNSKTYHGQSTSTAPDITPDDTVAKDPCEAAMVDVKLTEAGLPWFLKPVGGLLTSVVPQVAYINAHARVSVNQLEDSVGGLPIGVPDPTPKSARAIFVNESSGAVLGSTPLSAVGTTGALKIFDNAASPLPVKLDSGDTAVGVVIALSGTSSTTCGDSLVNCYDAGAPLNSGTPSKGILHIRGWSAAGSALQPAEPIARQVELVDGTCSDPYFSSASSSCTIGVRAVVDFGTGANSPVTAVGAKLTATVGGTTYPLTYASGEWRTATTIPIAAGAGPVPVTLDWEEQIGRVGTNNCTTSNGNKCNGSFGTVQRAFGAVDDRSGPIKVAQVLEDGLPWADSLERCSAVQTSCTHNLVVRVGVNNVLKNATGVSDPEVSLRVAGSGSQTQSLDCDPNANTSLKDQLALGCQPTYEKNTGQACPSTMKGLPQPWKCVDIRTGQAVNQVGAGMNQRILGTDKPTACTSPNHWSDFPNLSPSDPRIVSVFLTPFGTFQGSGNGTVPVQDFATFYVTGWAGSGNGFNNPCPDPVPASGYIVGHFIKYVRGIGSGSGSPACDPNSFGACVAVMTR